MSLWACAFFSFIFLLFRAFFMTMYPAVCKVVFQRFNRSFSQLTFITLYFVKSISVCVDYNSVAAAAAAAVGVIWEYVAKR